MPSVGKSAREKNEKNLLQMEHLQFTFLIWKIGKSAICRLLTCSLLTPSANIAVFQHGKKQRKESAIFQLTWVSERWLKTLAARQREQEQVFRGATFQLWRLVLSRQVAHWLASVTSPSCQICTKHVEVLKEALYSIKQGGTKEGMAYVWLPQRQLEKTFLCSFPSGALKKKELQSLIGESKYDEDKDGSGIKTGSRSSSPKLQSLEAVCWLPVCSLTRRGRSLRFCLSKHIQSGPVFWPTAHFQPQCFLLWAECVVHCECGKGLAVQGPPKRRKSPVAHISIGRPTRPTPETKCHHWKCHLLSVLLLWIDN